jgi:hypothetical protein
VTSSRKEYNRQHYLANREQAIARARENYRQNIPRERARYRRRRLAGYRNPRDVSRNELKEQFWAEQDGYCYLCGEPLASLETAHLDHDHRCCPRHEYCRYCIRGLSCPPCNLLIGNAGDDPDRMELVARNLRAKLAEMAPRLASKPEQMTLDDALLN